MASAKPPPRRRAVSRPTARPDISSHGEASGNHGLLTGEAIAAGAADLGIQLSPRQASLLAQYARLLLRWNRTYNLTAIDRPADLLALHLLDSLAILPELDRICVEQCSIVDIGSGAGLPGIPLAVARPAFDVTVLDKVAKKVAFTTQVKAELSLPNLTCVQAVAEKWAAEPFRVVVSRAYSDLATFVRTTRHLLASGGYWCAMKGALPRDELDQLAREEPGVRVERAVKLRLASWAAHRHLVVMRLQL